MKKSNYFNGALLILTLLFSLYYSCKKGGSSATTGTGVSGTPCNTLKVRPVGMTWRNGLPPLNYQPVKGGPITNAVFQLNWSDLQPDVYTVGGKIDTAASAAASNIRWNLIDKAIADWTAAGYPGIPLRLYSGINAPKWVKMLGTDEADPGIPDIMTIWVNPLHNHGDSIETSPRYWTQKYQDAHDLLTSRIAAKYESNSKFIAFYAFGAATAYSEYCINGMSKNVDVFRKNGMTTKKMKDAIRHFANKYNELFPTTHIIIWHSLPGFQGCTDGTDTAPAPVSGVYKMYSDEQFVTEMINLWRSFGNHAMNGSNDLDATQMNSSELTRMVAAGGPIGHQTRQLSLISDTYNTCDAGTDKAGGYAAFIELPAGNTLTMQQLTNLTTKAKSNDSMYICP
jgi:hypothetical protein